MKANPAGYTGQLRWPITLVTEIQEPGADMGVIETYTNERHMFAAIEAVSGATYYLGQQTDSEVTHRITVRWIDYADKVTFIHRDVVINGVARTERYHIRNWQDATGARRYVTLFCNMQSTGST